MTTKKISELKAPHNVFVLSPYIRSTLDIRWDNPALLPDNQNYTLAGCNVYRANDNPEGDYVQLNATPVTALQYRDSLNNRRITERIPVDNITFGDDPKGDYVLKVRSTPMVNPTTIDPQNFDLDPASVSVVIDGQAVIPSKVDGPEGLVYLDKFQWFCVETEEWVDPILPSHKTVIEIGDNTYISPSNYIGQATGTDSQVDVSYNHISHIVRTNLDKRLYYKVTTVTTNGYESPLSESVAHSVRELERLTYIWQEAIRRNRWILQQTAHRVKLFFRPWFGTRCHCWKDRNVAQPNGDCPDCYGTGFEGGYLGPVDVLLAPPDTEKNLELTDLGLRLNWIISVWTEPTPEINQRDLIVDKDNRRFTVGPVNKKSCRGMILQQDFEISLLDETDVRYQVPLTGNDAVQQITDKASVPDSIEIRGRTDRFEGILY